MKRYDLHIHTRYSKCSNLTPEVILRRAKKKGMDGIAITDHNKIEGAFEVAAANTDSDFEVIIGEEVSTDKGEVLGLYLKDKIKPGKFEEVVDAIHKQGGIAVIAHPYSSVGISRQKADIDNVVDKIDAIEGFNARSSFSFENIRSQIKAKEMGLPITAGSDAHYWFEIGRAYVEFEGNLRYALKNNSTEVHGSILYSIPGKICTVMRKYVLGRFLK